MVMTGGHVWAPEDAYLAMCAVVKDQSEDVREWLDWQLALGVGRIYFFDNNSSAPMLSQMSDLVASGRVVYTFFVRHPRKVYTKCASCRCAPNGCYLQNKEHCVFFITS